VARRHRTPGPPDPAAARTAPQCWELATRSGDQSIFLRLFENDQRNRVGLIAAGLLATGAANSLLYFPAARVSGFPPLPSLALPSSPKACRCGKSNRKSHGAPCRAVEKARTPSGPVQPPWDRLWSIWNALAARR
jgi:hypothetical protein